MGPRWQQHIMVGDMVEIMFTGVSHLARSECGRRGRVVRIPSPNYDNWKIDLGHRFAKYGLRSSLKLVAQPPKVLTLCL